MVIPFDPARDKAVADELDCNQEVVARVKEGVSGPQSPVAADFLPLTDEAASRFVDAFAARIASQLMRFRLPTDLVEDTTQEVLMRCLRGLPGFRGESALSTWVWRITWREGTRTVGRLARRREIILDSPPEPAVESTDPVETADEAARLRTAMRRLPEMQRLALAYHHLDGMSVAETAQVMGVPPNTVKSHLKRGRERLREVLGEELT